MHRAEEILVDEIMTRLRTREDGDTPVLGALLPPLARLFHANRGGSYDLMPHETAIATTFLHAWSFSADAYRHDFNAMLRRRPVGWGTYDPFRPAPGLRNRAGIVRPTFFDDNRKRVPELDQLVRRYSWLREEEELRILACEGSSFLAWWGVMRRDPFTERDRRMMQRFARPLQERLIVERQLSFAPLAFQAMAAALEAVGAPAFLFRPPAAVAFANSSGRLLLDLDRTGTLQALNASMGDDPAGYALSRLSSPGAPPLLLAISRRCRTDATARVAALSRRWGLTRRQSDVLQRLASGASNKDIAQTLHCGESAVETHVTSLFARAGAASRSDLVARFWTERV